MDTGRIDGVLRVGVLGGGQLGRMMAYATKRLPGLELMILDPQGRASPAGEVAEKALAGSCTDPQAVRTLAAAVDVLTCEIEHVDAGTLAALEDEGFTVHPSSATIAVIQDKLAQKQHLSAHKIPLPRFVAVHHATVESVCDAAISLNGFPIMLKSRRLAYDGRGNYAVMSERDAEAASAALSGELYAEAWCNFKAELAVMIARSRTGEVVAYPVVETRQENNICHTVFAPPSFPLSDRDRTAAQKVALDAVASLPPCAGVFGVELFLLHDGTVLLNEIAPRPHNSGHYTLEACETDQFEMHLRAVAGLPLGSPALKVGASCMINVLGRESMGATMDVIRAAIATKGCSVHWYNKKENKPGRKMAHITCVASNETFLRDRLNAFHDAIGQPRIIPSTILSNRQPIVGVIMGSDSDLPTMSPCADILNDFEVPFELTIVSAHRTPERMVTYAKTARQRGLQIIVAGAGGAAHLPGMVAALTDLPVIGVPVKASSLDGQDSLLSIVQMPRGIPVATVAIGNSTNAGLLAVRILASIASNTGLLKKLETYHESQRNAVEEKASRLETIGYASYLSREEK